MLFFRLKTRMSAKGVCCNWVEMNRYSALRTFFVIFTHHSATDGQPYEYCQQQTRPSSSPFKRADTHTVSFPLTLRAPFSVGETFCLFMQCHFFWMGWGNNNDAHSQFMIST